MDDDSVEKILDGIYKCAVFGGNTFYTVVNTVLVGPAENAETVPIGVEPVLFGLLYMGFDMLFIAVKNGIIKVFKDAATKSGNGKK